MIKKNFSLIKLFGAGVIALSAGLSVQSYAQSASPTLPVKSNNGINPETQVDESQFNHLNCQPATLNEYDVLVLSTALNSEALMQKLTSTYCYDLETFSFDRVGKPHPIFFSPTPTFLNYYLQTSRNFIDLKEPESKLDVLSHFLIIPYTSYNSTDSMKRNKILQTIYPYYPEVKANWFQNKYQTIDNFPDKYRDPDVWRNYQEMVNILAMYYRNLLTLPVDEKDNTALNYAILTNQAVAMEEILKGPYYNFYKVNKDGYTPFHLAFSEKFFLGSEAEKEKNLQKINNLLIENFRPERTAFLDIKDVTFNEFIELMKDFNPNLYEMIITKQKELKMEIPEVNIELIKDNKEYYIDSMKSYITDKE